MNINNKLVSAQEKIKLLALGVVLVFICAIISWFNRFSMAFLIIVFLAVLLLSGSMTLLVLILRTLKEIDSCLKEKADLLNGNIDRAITDNYKEIQCSDTEDADVLDQVMKNFYKLGIKMQSDDKKNKEYSDFIRESISNISHDLKTPLSSIRGYAEGLVDRVADTEEKKEQYAKMIISKVGTITSLLSELSYYSSIDTDSVLDVILPVSVKEYFDDCVDEINPELQMKHINFTYINSVEPDVKFCIDVQKISKAVKNIIGNAIKFVDYDRGIIMLKVEDKDDLIEVSIQDNGRGVPADKLPLIFERYYKADTARSSGRSGSGIGLSIVKKVVEDHGGQVFAESKEGLGTVIRFTLHKYYGEE